MKITRENCEAWFLDYYEGVLDFTRTEELFAFLAVNPEMQEVFESFEDVSFDTSTTLDEASTPLSQEWKNSLKKEVPEENGISETNYNAWIVALMEGTLDAKEEKMVKDFMATRPKVQREFELLKKTVVKADTSATLGAGVKNSLKKAIVITDENFMEMAVQAMDGELDEVTMLSFFDYIAAYETCKKQYDELLKTKLVADVSATLDAAIKHSLKKTPVVVTAENFNEYAIQAMDEELDQVAAISFFDYIAKHKSFEIEFEKLKRTKLVADETVVFPGKESLKKKDRGGIVWWQFTSYAAAAVVILFFGIYLFNRTNVNQIKGDNHSIANVNPLNNNHNSADSDSTHVIVPVNHDNNTQQLADVNTIHNNVLHPHHDHGTNSNGSNNQVKSNLVNTDAVAFNVIPAKNINHVDQHLYTNVDFSGTFYQSLGQTSEPVAANTTPSFGQFAMRWMKDKLDTHGNKNTNDDQDGDMVALNNAKNNGNVTGFDLTASAIDRLGYATNSNLHLEHNTDGTVLTAFGYDVVLSHN